MNLKPRTKVRCLKVGPWLHSMTGQIGPGPAFNEECTITQVEQIGKEKYVVAIEGYENFFDSMQFEAIDE